MIKTREEIREAWLQELEEYPERQIEGHLGSKFPDGTEKYCCLGQLCKITISEENTEYKTGYSSEQDIYFKGHSLVLPVEVVNLVGLRSVGGDLKTPFSVKGKFYTSLSAMNDDAFTWPEIAAYIRANPENVFVD